MLTGIAEIDRFQGAWAAHGGLSSDRAARIREASTILSVAASGRLSGIRLSDAEVAGLLSGESVPVRDSGLVLGYAAAMAQPLPSSQEVFAIEHLQQLHATMVGERTATAWRAEPLIREAFDDHGRAKGRTFSTLPTHLIETKVDDLLTWLEFELRTREQHPVLVIGTFILGLQAASPFPHSNARLSRLLISRLLDRAGYGYLPYASVESQIEDLRDVYHETFDRSHARFWKDQGNLEPWLEFFVDVLARHRQRVESKLTIERDAQSLPPLQQSILDAIREHGTVDAGLLLRATGANRNTLKDNLRRLVQRGVLEKSGERRGTRYRLSVPDRARPAYPKT
jgi:Fic family protein